MTKELKAKNIAFILFLVIIAPIIAQVSHILFHHHEHLHFEHHTTSSTIQSHEEQCPICKYEFAKYTKTESIGELNPRNITYAILGESIVIIKIETEFLHNYIRGPPSRN